MNVIYLIQTKDNLEKLAITEVMYSLILQKLVIQFLYNSI
jgi:hypothetical protein